MPLLLLALALPPADSFAERALPVLERHCFACHSARRHKGDLVLEGPRTEGEALALGAERWAAVRELVASGEMPPGGRPQPRAEERRALLDWIDASGAPPAPAPPPLLRRLNDLEYERAVQDLFGVPFQARGRFPADGVAHGFSTAGEALSMSTLELELYLAAAGEIAAAAIVVDDSAHPARWRFEGPALEGELSESGGRAWVPLASTRQRAGARVALPRTGVYRVELELWAMQAGDELARAALVVDGVDRFEGELAGNLDAGAQHLTTELELEGGVRHLEVRFLNDHYDPEHPDPAQRDRNVYVTAITAQGPLDPPRPSAFQQRLAARFDDEGALLAHLVRRVWRRPARAGEVERLLALSAPGASPEERRRDALTALLASPHFLYRVEEERGGGALDGPELAARLAAFLWSSVPDEALDAAADDGQLVGDAGLAAQVERMLADPRVDGLAAGFALPWLQLGPLERIAPDADLFPEWGPDLAASARAETEALFLDVLRERRPVWDLLEADSTRLDARLARHYGLDVDVPAGAPLCVSLAGTARRGVLGQASVLAVTSQPTRTSPVRRGKWVLEVLLGAPPPDPPPGVGALEEDAPGSVRDRLEAHTANPDCAACHEAMDPLGFGLEVFDPVGRYRSSVGGEVLDARGVLPDGRAFVGPLGLVELLRADGRFPRVVLAKLATYAYGRALGPEDRRFLDATLVRLDQERVTLDDLVRAVATSPAFRTRPPSEDPPR